MEASRLNFATSIVLPFGSKNKIPGSNWIALNDSVSTSRSSLKGNLFTSKAIVSTLDCFELTFDFRRGWS